ncbi:MAG: Rieske 2Fe-2S domain-containing protein, partial [Spongiibacteraceae bacterium]
MKNNNQLWWPICLSESVSTDKPIGLRLDDIALAVYRDGNGYVRAVEDRCPHRRAPLSLGRITPQGHIQCGYHGWTFNGETGDICGFPNLDPEERLPRCSIDTYTILENNGVIYLGLCEQPNELVTVTEQLTQQADGTSSSGRIMQGLSHQEAVMAFLDNPNYFLNIIGVEFLDKILGNPKTVDGLLVCERAARWNLIGESRFYLGPLRHRADFPLRLQTVTTPITGET